MSFINKFQNKTPRQTGWPAILFFPPEIFIICIFIFLWAFSVQTTENNGKYLVNICGQATGHEGNMREG